MKTPLYVFSEEKIRENYKKIVSVMNKIKICYAMKANSEEGVLRILAEEGAWFECASKGEFDIASQVGIRPEQIIFGLPIKTEETITYVYERGERYFVFDDVVELEKLIKLAPNSNKLLRIKVNDISPDTIDFGMSMERIMENTKNWLKYVDGITFHISNNSNLEVFGEVSRRVCEILEILNKNSKKKYIVNIGGGLSLSAGQDFYDGINKIIEGFMEAYDVEFYAEPGEAIVNTSGKFYTKVIMTKRNGRLVDVYIDAGIPQGIAVRRIPSAINIYGCSRVKDEKVIYRFIDCTCMGAALFTKRTNLDIQDDDILEFEGCGAYSVPFCNDFHAYEKCRILFKENFRS